MLAGAAGVLLASAVRTQPMRDGALARADTQVDALLASVGGRDAWASAKGYQVWARHHLAAEKASFPNSILLDFAAPRLRIESAQQGLWRARIVDGNQGWRITRDSARTLTAEEVADDRSFWSANVYRSLHRLAARDEALSAQSAADRLLILERGKPLIWFRQNLAGEPIAFGPGDAADGTIFGPLMAYGPLKFPSFSVRDGGRWRAIIDRFEVDPDLSTAAIRRGVPPG